MVEGLTRVGGEGCRLMKTQNPFMPYTRGGDCIPCDAVRSTGVASHCQSEVLRLPQFTLLSASSRKGDGARFSQGPA